MNLLTLILTKPKMDKQTNKRKEYITNPARIISFCVFLFGLWVTYASITARIARLEEFQRSVDLVKIETTLREIQVDLSRVKNALSNKQ